MAKLYRLTILTPEQTVFDGEVSALVAPGAAGSLGVLADHAPLATPLLPGRLEFTDSTGRRLTVTVAGAGLLEVSKAGVMVLAEGVGGAPTPKKTLDSRKPL